MSSSKASEFVVEIDGRHWVAYWDEKACQWKGPVKDGTKVGLTGFYCRKKSEIPKMGGYSYASRAGAMRKARETYCLD